MSIVLTEEQQESHITMRNRFIELAGVINTPAAPEDCSNQMMTVLNTYADQFQCSTASAYSRIKFNLISLVR